MCDLKLEHRKQNKKHAYTRKCSYNSEWNGLSDRNGKCQIAFGSFRSPDSIRVCEVEILRNKVYASLSEGWIYSLTSKKEEVLNSSLFFFVFYFRTFF